MKPETPIDTIPRIGPAYKKRLEKLRIRTVRDLLFHVPARYQDFSEVTPVKQLVVGDETTIKGEIIDVKNSQTYKRRIHVTEVTIEDESGTVRAIWYNQPYLIDTLLKGERLMISGRVALNRDGVYIGSPVHEMLGGDLEKELIHTGRLVPVYPETDGLSSRWLRMIIKGILSEISDWDDPLPEELRQRNDIMSLTDAIDEIHFPTSTKSAENAKRRLAFEELLNIQLLVLQEKMKIQQAGAPAIASDIEATKRFVESLDFPLTDAQRKASWQIMHDLALPHPMNRLLEGDVGSGKTVVAMIAALNTVRSGAQVAIMAPTEILAEQHFKEFSKRLAGEKFIIGLYTSSHHMRNSLKVLYSPFKISKTKLKKEVGEGEINIIIGTHALLSDSVQFKNLGLLVVDEQHRFGVEQRANLSKKRGDTQVAHLLSMTATPIPRTLALTVYGDLDLSVLDEMPKDRKPIETKIVTPSGRNKTYEFVRAQIKEGRQAYIIYPLIEESEKLDGRAATKEYERLQKEVFPELSLGLLHGKIKTKEKQDILGKFKDGDIDILIATSVVEVGIDVPNAAVMIIDGAQRFGLAQLHQFRGRIGRDKYQSYCFLMSEGAGQKTRERLQALTKSANGFELAEEDLKIRGPGDLYGVRQSGMPDLAMSSLGDLPLIESAREEAKTLLTESSTLAKWPAIKTRVEEMRKTVHFE